MNLTSNVPSDLPTYATNGIFAGWNRFWFRPVSPLGLHVIRLLTGLLVVGWLLGYATTYHELLGTDGWFDAEAYQAATRLPEDANVPTNWGHSLIPSSPMLLGIMYLGSLIVAVLFTLGIATRITAPLVWLVVVAFTSNPVLYYGGDAFLIVLTLYLAIGYIFLDLVKNDGAVSLILGSSSAPAWRWKSASADLAAPTSVLANLILKLIQVHVAVIVFMSVLHKFQDPEWWAGDALWYHVYQPFATDVKSLLGQQGRMNGTLIFLSIATYATLIWQLTYPIQPITRQGRWIMLAGSLIGWAWCALIAGQPIYGPGILIGSLAALPANHWPTWILRNATMSSVTNSNRDDASSGWASSAARS